jgi:phospholipid-binding lipoprotein MlaA
VTGLTSTGRSSARAPLVIPSAGWSTPTYDPVWRVDDIPLRNSLVAVRYVDLRASVLPTDKVIEEAAFDKYSYIRDAYLQHRRSEIFDGDPPRTT